MGEMALSFTALTDFDSSLPRPEASRPSVSRPPLPPPEVELPSGQIGRDPEPGAGPQAEESAAVSSPAPVSPTRRRALDRYLTLRRYAQSTFLSFSLFSLTLLFQTFSIVFSRPTDFSINLLS